MSRLFAMAVPIPPGNEKKWEKFIMELNDTRHEDFMASRQRLGVRERTFFQQTPMGSMVIVTLEGDEPEVAFQQFAQGKDEFTRWFVRKVKEVHGIDLSAPPSAPLPSLVIDSDPVDESVGCIF